MTDRFSLRFAHGERQGEVVPITQPRFTVGRRPGSDLEIQDGSVSGRHAEFVVDGESVLVRDLGSTNGTRVGAEKITERGLAHGDEVVLGSIKVVVLDRDVGGGPAEDEGRTAAGSASGETIEKVSAELLARSGKRSKIGLLGAAVLVIVGIGAALYLQRGGESRGVRGTKAVVPVDGNLIAGYSFEGAEPPANWTSSDAAPAEFTQEESARSTGEFGLRAKLDSGEWALLACDPVAVQAGRALALTAGLRARGGTPRQSAAARPVRRRD